MPIESAPAQPQEVFDYKLLPKIDPINGPVLRLQERSKMLGSISSEAWQSLDALTAHEATKRQTIASMAKIALERTESDPHPFLTQGIVDLDPGYAFDYIQKCLDSKKSLYERRAYGYNVYDSAREEKKSYARALAAIAPSDPQRFAALYEKYLKEYVLYQKSFRDAVAYHGIPNITEIAYELAGSIGVIASSDPDLFVKLYKSGLESDDAMIVNQTSRCLSALAPVEPEKFIELFKSGIEYTKSQSDHNNGTVQSNTKISSYDADVSTMNPEKFMVLFKHLYPKNGIYAMGLLGNFAKNYPIEAAKLYEKALRSDSTYTKEYAVMHLDGLADSDPDGFLKLFKKAVKLFKDQPNKFMFINALKKVAQIDPRLYFRLQSEWTLKSDEMGWEDGASRLKGELVKTIPYVLSTSTPNAKKGIKLVQEAINNPDSKVAEAAAICIEDLFLHNKDTALTLYRQGISHSERSVREVSEPVLRGLAKADSQLFVRVYQDGLASGQAAFGNPDLLASLVPINFDLAKQLLLQAYNRSGVFSAYGFSSSSFLNPKLLAAFFDHSPEFYEEIFQKFIAVEYVDTLVTIPSLDYLSTREKKIDFRQLLNEFGIQPDEEVFATQALGDNIANKQPFSDFMFNKLANYRALKQLRSLINIDEDPLQRRQFSDEFKQEFDMLIKTLNIRATKEDIDAISLLLKSGIYPTVAILEHVKNTGNRGIDDLKKLARATASGAFDPGNQLQRDLEYIKFLQLKKTLPSQEVDLQTLEYHESGRIRLLPQEKKEAEAAAFEAAQFYLKVKQLVEARRRIDPDKIIEIVGNERYALFITEPLRAMLEKLGVRISMRHVGSSNTHNASIQDIFSDSFISDLEHDNSDVIVVDGTKRSVDNGVPRLPRSMWAYINWFQAYNRASGSNDKFLSGIRNGKNLQRLVSKIAAAYPKGPFEVGFWTPTGHEKIIVGTDTLDYKSPNANSKNRLAIFANPVIGNPKSYHGFPQRLSDHMPGSLDDPEHLVFSKTELALTSNGIAILHNGRTEMEIIKRLQEEIEASLDGMINQSLWQSE